MDKKKNTKRDDTPTKAERDALAARDALAHQREADRIKNPDPDDAELVPTPQP